MSESDVRYSTAASLTELQRVQRYVVLLARYAEERHPLGVSQDDCQDECLVAEAIKYAHSLRGQRD